MRTLAVCLIAASLLVLVPAAEAGPPSGSGCDVKEEYVTEAYVETDPDDPTDAVHFGAHRPIECYY